MYEILFYIFTFIILSAVFKITFTGSSYTLFIYLSLMLSGFSGFFLILNYEFISALLALFILAALSAFALSRKYIIKIPAESQIESKLTFSSVIFISLLTALLCGLPGTAKWEKFDITLTLNNFSSLFNIYLPVLLAAALLVSVLISTALKLFIPERTDH